MPATARPSRRALRLPAFDYREHGAYFFTSVIHSRQDLVGRIQEDTVRLSLAGKAVECAWLGLADRFPTIELDAFVVMPDHVHGILILDHAGLLAKHDANSGTPHAAICSLSDVVGAFKSISARDVNAILGRTGPLWQRSYYERVVRGQRDLDQLRKYIEENPLRWTIAHDH